MNVAGVDLSTRAIDIVKVPLDTVRAPEWHRFPLAGSDAFDRARSVRDALPGRTSVIWDDVLALGIEDPRGHGAGHIYRVQGAILSCLPAHLLVHPLIPSQWRKLVGLKGNASKEDAFTLAIQYVNSHGHNTWPLAVPTDATDACCIALATRSLITRKEAAA